MFASRSIRTYLLAALIALCGACTATTGKETRNLMADNAPSTQTEISAPHIVAANDLKGSVIVTQRGAIKIHTYVSPADSFLVTTQIIEGPSKLIVFDGQALKPYAEEVATYVQRLGKPVDRIILSHGHPDHWAGLEALLERLPETPVYSLAGVTSFVRAAGEQMLGNLRKKFGDKVASQVVLPSRVLHTGAQTIDGIGFDFRELLDGEASIQLVALMPDQKVVLAFDLVFAPGEHVFTVQPTFDHWIGILDGLKALGGYDTIMIGHGRPTGRAAYDATIAYLQRAKQIHAWSKDAKSYADALKAAFPDREQPGWVDFSSMILYAHH